MRKIELKVVPVTRYAVEGSDYAYLTAEAAHAQGVVDIAMKAIRKGLPSEHTRDFVRNHEVTFEQALKIAAKTWGVSE